MSNQNMNTQGHRANDGGAKLAINKETIRTLETGGSEGIVDKATGIRCPTARADTECCVVGGGDKPS